MIKLIKKELDKFYNLDSEYNYVIDEVCENNRKLILVFSSIFIAIFSVLVALGFAGFAVESKDIPVFALALAYAVITVLLVKVGPKHNRTATMIATYLVMGAMVLYGLIISYRSPDQYTVTFIALLCIMSMTFIDRPVRIGFAHILTTVLCIVMIFVHKAEAIRIADTINVLSFSLLSFIGGYYIVKMKVHGFAMDKKQKEDIEKGRQRLSEVQAEALQLLTAVSSTYDMIVSVNLTQNKYELIGEESFVTKNDPITGCFDDVIDVHAAKVVDGHRQTYLNTFSRQALLKAHAEGKKEVYLEYQQCDESGEPHWLGTHTMFTNVKNSDDVTEITISQNIDERISKEEEIKAILQAERDRAEQAQKAKTDFLFQMSHDIRTPMNAIIGFTNFIKDSDNIDTIHNDYVKKLEISGQQLLMLINDALEMSRIESGKMVFRNEVRDINEIINNVMSVMQIQADEKGVLLSSEFSVSNPIVECDQNHMNRVVLNLISNAVKFTHSGGRVDVSLCEKPAAEGYACFELKVADTGIGMSRQFVEKVFEPFEREQTSTVSGMQGTGLGLTIVKRIIEAAGGTIAVESEQGKGTVFTVTITMHRPSLEEQNMFKRFNGIDETDNTALEERMTAYFSGKRILLVEDNDFNLTIAQVILENAGFVVDTAENGQVAVDKIVNAPVPDYYELVLMDVQMPVMNGYEATKKIRALKDSRADVVIIAVTANAFDTDKDDAIDAGMNGHIAKPIDVNVLYKTIWQILNN